MPLAAWICKTHGGVPLTHWRGGECPLYDPIIIDTLLAKREGDHHKGAVLTPTTVLGCPRQIILERYLPYALAPDSMLTPHVGTLVHAGVDHLLKRYGPKVNGSLFGYPFVGELDAPPENGVITDLKTTRTSMKNLPKDDHKVQISMYGLLWNEGREAIEGSLAYGGRISYLCSTPYGWRTKRVDFSLWNEERIAAHKPSGGTATVLQNVTDFVNAAARCEDGEDPRMVAGNMPLTGVPQFVGLKCTRYCDQKAVCDDCHATVDIVGFVAGESQ